MSVYMVVEIKVKDQKKYEQYVAAASEIIPKYGGRFLVRGGRITPLPVGLHPDRRLPEQMIIVEYPSELHLRRCFASPEYKEIVQLRNDGVDARAVVLEGYKPEKQ
jgi:uncharacterized protein (DUF1330 family)